ncbi:hypothetical protein [Jatrophihabitans endophyticus]|uniref:hypothetical protein n=1 Tax=Jatrophihabitans endophyticus TaxID=1206085 RepID=UPI0019DBD262|nr:hypothetical protein [Jatrophihabitans endophyticus]MBE7189957.1 hypothetical protein [Jatrophihabitans endophyticus]
MADRKPRSRVPSAVGSIPLVGDVVRSADAQAQWMQDVLEQNARLVGQFPATLKSFNDALERFNQTVARLDATVTRIEGATRTLTGPLEKVAGTLDPRTLREIPEALDSLRTSLTDEAVPALRAATDTQRQVASLQSTVERVITTLAELPGAGIFRRLSTARTPVERDGRAEPNL